MAKIALPYTIINGDPVDAGPVQSNYQTIETYSNQELIERGGTVAMTAQLKLVGNPVAALDAAPKQYVDTMVPIGGILLFAGSTAPVGGTWLLCDGTEYQQATYPELAAVIGAANGRFNVPALINRVPVGGGGDYAHKSIGGSADAVVIAHGHDISHTHAANNTGTVSNDHSHAVNITSGASDRALGTSSNGDHSHVVALAGSSGFLVDGIGASPSAGIDLGEENAYGFVPATSVAGAHTHSVTDHLHAVSGYTGGISADHTHTSQTPTFNGASNQVGVAGAGLNMPRYFALAFIIRAK